MRLTLFDLDNTLLNGDSDFEWAQFLIRQGILDGAQYAVQNQAFYDDYKAGTLDIFAFLDFQLKPLAGRNKATLQAWHAYFMSGSILPIITPAARALVAQHQAAGDLVVIITATNRFVTAPIAAEFGVDHLIATELAQDAQGNFTGKPAGIPCFREQKITRLNLWLETQGQQLQDFSHTAFYSDSLNDLPLLRCVNEAIAVNPDPQLAAHAASHGWKILNLHERSSV